MVVMNMAKNEIIGEMLRSGDKNVKNCLSFFDPKLSSKANGASLAKKTRRSELDSFAEFLGIPSLYGAKGVKDPELGTVDLIAYRIAQELAVLTVPAKCAECSVMYVHKRAEVAPLRCFLCHQPSHNCEPIKAAVEEKNQATLLLTGDVWLCEPCCVPKKGGQPGTPLGKKVSSRIATPTRSRTGSFSESAIAEPKPEIEAEIKAALDAVAIEAKQSEEDEKEEAERRKKEEEEEVKDLLPNTSLTTCPLLKEGSCPHGGSGKREVNGKSTCEYWHPKSCKQWTSKGEDGCSKGLECKKLHKVLCEDALKSKECLDKSCRLAHIKGTVRMKVSNPKDKKVVGNVANREERGRKKSEPVRDSRKKKDSKPKRNEKRPFSKVVDEGKGKGKSSDEPRLKPGGNPLKRNADSKEKSFLEIHSLLKELQRGMNMMKKDQIEMKKTIGTLTDGRSWGRNRVGSGHHGCCGQVFC